MQSNAEFNAKSTFMLRSSWVPNIVKEELLSGTLLSILLVASCDHEHQPCLLAESGQPWELNCIPEIIAR